jgi:hypothetical protein
MTRVELRRLWIEERGIDEAPRDLIRLADDLRLDAARGKFIASRMPDEMAEMRRRRMNLANAARDLARVLRELAEELEDDEAEAVMTQPTDGRAAYPEMAKLDQARARYPALAVAETDGRRRRKSASQ